MTKQAQSVNLRLWILLIFSVVFLPALSATQSLPAEHQLFEAAQRRTAAVLAAPGADAQPAKAFAELLQLALLEQPAVEMVERGALEAVLREQHVAALFGADGDADHIRLGELFKADLLVFVRPSKRMAEHVDVTLSETRYGLRLMARTLDPSDKNAVKGIAAAIDQAVDRMSRPITDLVAVPPFLNHSLTPGHDHLGGAFAMLMQQTLLADRGVLLVELDESLAIARELVIEGQAPQVQRWTPILVRGAYLHEQTPQGPRMRLHVTAERAGRELARHDSGMIEPHQTAAFLRETVEAVLAAAGQQPGGRDAARRSGMLEAQVICERAQQAKHHGDRETAMHLAHAALLLDPYHWEAMALASLCIRDILLYDLASEKLAPETFEANREQAYALWLTAMDHLRFYVEHRLFSEEPWNPRIHKKEQDDILWGASRHTYLHPRPDAPPDSMSPVDEPVRRTLDPRVQDELADYQRFYRAELQRHVQAGTLHPSRLRYIWRPSFLYDSRDSGEMGFTRHVVELLLIVQGGLEYHQPLAAYSTVRGLRTTKETDWALENYGEAMNPTLRSHVESLRISYMDGELRRRRAVVPRSVTSEASADRGDREPGVVATRLDLRVKRRGALGEAYTWESIHPHGWLRAQPGVDVLWNSQELFTMREPGVLETLYRHDVPVGDPTASVTGVGFHSASYDGRYIWASVVGEVSALVVVDLESGGHWTLGEQGELPLMNQGAALAVLGPGRACLIGAAGGRHRLLSTWIAVIEFDGDGLTVADLIVPPVDPLAPVPEGTRPLRFLPHHALTITDPNDSTEQRVLVHADDYGWWWRRGVSPGLLAIDPARQEVKSIASHPPSLSRTTTPGPDGAVYWIRESDVGGYLWRFGFPDLEAVRLRPLSPIHRGNLWWINGQLFHWSGWLLKHATDPMKPWQFLPGRGAPFDGRGASRSQMLESQHHGLIMMRQRRHRALPSDVWELTIPNELLLDAHAGRQSRPNPVVRGHTHDYQFYDGEWTWDQAVQIAQMMGGELLVSETEEAHARIQTLAPSHRHRTYWTAVRGGSERAAGVDAAERDAALLALTVGKKEAVFLQGQAWEAGNREQRRGVAVQWPRSDPLADGAAPQHTDLTEAADFVNSVGIGFVAIPVGEFVMGSPPDEPGRLENETQHRVEMPGRIMVSQTLVTYAQWKVVTVDLKGLHHEFYARNEHPDLPALVQHWESMLEFCRHLSQLEGRTYRLLTEAEWEYVARAGSTTAWHSGDMLDDLKRVGWVSYDGEAGSSGGVRPVAQLEPNAWGLYDMHGLVWEWTATRPHAYGEPAVHDNGLMQNEGAHPHILRGGAWYSPPHHSRAAFRYWATTSYSAGFRVVLELDGKDEHPSNSDASPAATIPDDGR